MTENKRKITRNLLIIVLAILLVNFILSFKQENIENKINETKKLVSTEIIELSNNIIKIPISGKLKSVKEVNIISEVNGIFQGDRFKTGNRFLKGDTLGYIKYDEVENMLNSQKSNLLNQVSRLVSEIKFDYPETYNVWLEFMNNIQFNKPLPDLPKINSAKFKNYLSGKEFYTAYYSTKTIQDKLSKHIIISNFNGILSEVNIKTGTMVIFGQKIGRFQDPNILEFESSTNIKNTLLIKKKQDVIIQSDEIEGIYKGYVSRINKTIEESSQNMSVFIQTTNNNLYSGMYVHGSIIIGENENSYSIKRSLLKNNKIYIIKDNKLIEKKISIIHISDGRAIITGINNGDEILSESVKGSFSGMSVRIQNR